MRAIFSFTPFIDRELNMPVYYQLYEYIKKEIISGNIKANEKLPSLRRLSKHVQLSKNTVESAYDQLYAEGYIKRVPRVGYLVDDISTELWSTHKVDKTSVTLEYIKNDKSPVKYNFASRYMDKDCYNMKIWKTIIDSTMNNEFETLLCYGDPQGEYELRYELAKYVYENRGVHCHPDQIVVGAGTQYCLNMITQILMEEYSIIGMEEPGSSYVRNVFEQNKLCVKPIDVNEDGLDVKQLENTKCKLVFVTPSHQFPKGVIMSVKNRLQLLSWARNNNGIIIEDDYDSEMRFVGKPIPSLKSLDIHDNVIYLGTFSKILIPSLRISFMVLPKALLDIYHDTFKMNEQTCSKLNQIVLARFISKGYLQSHLRKMRKHYEYKYNIITEAIQKHMRDNVNLISSNAGLRVILELKTNLPEQQIIKLAEAEGIEITPISKYYINKINSVHKGTVRVLISYKGIPTEDIEPAIELLSRVWFR